MKKNKLSKEELFERYYELGTLQKTAKATGYSFGYLKRLCSIHKWKERRKLKDADDPNAFVEVIRGIDGSIQKITKTPILNRLPKSKNRVVEKLILDDEEILLDNIQFDEEGSVIIGKEEMAFMREKIKEREKAVENQKKEKEKKKKPREKRDPFERAIEKVIEVVPGAFSNRRQITLELKRWLSRYYSLEESVDKAILCMQGLEREKEAEAKKGKKIVDTRIGGSDRMWKKMWGDIKLG